MIEQKNKKLERFLSIILIVLQIVDIFLKIYLFA